MNAFQKFGHDVRTFFEPKNLKRRLRSKGKIFPIVAYGMLVLWVVFFLGMLIWAFFTSLKTDYDFMYYPLSLPQQEWLWRNYADAFSQLTVEVTRNGQLIEVGLGELLLNSLLLCVGVPLFALLDVACCAYVTSRYKRFKITRVIFAIVIFVNYVPVTASLASGLRIMKTLGLYDQIWGQWIAASGGFGAFFLIYYANFKSIPWSYAEAAFVDGASHFTVFWRIMLPMTRGTFGALFITSFITQWTDYMTPMIYLPTHPTIAQAAWGLQFSNTSVPYMLAGLFILALPVLILFCCFHKKLMGSMTIGGLKG